LKARITDDNSLILSHLSRLECAALKAVPELAASLPQPFWKRPPSSGSGSQEMLDDWKNYVAPEIERTHRKQCEHVERAVNRLDNEKEAQPGSGNSIRITEKDFDRWYGALNQARLSLEAHYQFGQTPHKIDQILSWPPEKLSRYLQSQFYQAIQIDLLEMIRATNDDEFGSDGDESL